MEFIVFIKDYGTVKEKRREMLYSSDDCIPRIGELVTIPNFTRKSKVKNVEYAYDNNTIYIFIE